MWDVTVKAVKRETVEVPAGKFKALLIEITPKPADDDTEMRTDFEGLFGIRGEIQVWVDQKTMIPLKIRGVVPFGIDLNMEVSLRRARSPAFPGGRLGS